MGMYSFSYQGLDDEFEHGKIIDTNFGSLDKDNGITIDEVVDMFSDYLRAIGYVFDNIEVNR